MKIKAYNREHDCATYEKGPDSLLLCDERGNPIASFCGIRNWDGYEADGVPLADIREAGAEEIADGAQNAD